MNKNNIIKHPLDEDKVNELINYENLYKNNNSKFHFDKIIKIYTSLVEYYDTHSDPMKNYFLEKIQDFTLHFNSNNNNNLINENISTTNISNFSSRKVFRSKKYTYDQNKKNLIEENLIKKITEPIIQINKTDEMNDKIKLLKEDIGHQKDLLKIRLLKRKEKKSFNKTTYTPNDNSYNNLSNILDDSDLKKMDTISEENLNKLN